MAAGLLEVESEAAPAWMGAAAGCAARVTVLLDVELGWLEADVATEQRGKGKNNGISI